jgi:hypothetical protein
MYILSNIGIDFAAKPILIKQIKKINIYIIVH